MSWITGVGLLPYGRHEAKSTLDLMSAAATLAMADAGVARGDIDGVLTGYATTMPHIMLATVFCEHFGLQPVYAHGLQVGGATGFAMVMLAHELVAAGRLRNVLVVAGENRMSAPGGRDKIVETLAQVGHPVHEVPLGPTIPAYYGLVANRYMHEYKISARDLAEFAVLMRANAATHPGAQFKEAITVDDVLGSKPIAQPLRLLDCCATADGGAAFVISRERTGAAGVRIIGAGQAHTHQHISEAPSLTEFGARLSMDRAIEAAGRKRQLHDHTRDPARRTGLGAARTVGPDGARRTFLPRRRQAAQYARRTAQLWPLRCRRRPRPPRRNTLADDGPRRLAPGCRYGPRGAARRRRRHVLACQPDPGAAVMSDGIRYQRCGGCGHTWYFVRSFCPRCGATAVSKHTASGRGVVHAVTIVDRAPTAEMKALAPYTLVMVDAEEGFRLMAHGAPGLAIDDPVQGSIVERAGRAIPLFRRV